jgi:tRNA (guanine-N7-)-methyltransferase
MTDFSDDPPGGAAPAGGEPREWRAYIRRRGRMTRGQARALEALSSRYRIAEGSAPIEPESVFARGSIAPLGLEIGFGMGHALLEWARQRPQWNLLGVEIYEPGVGAALLGLARDGLDNVRLVQAPAEHLLARLGAGVLDEVRIFFPDPWPKARHHKRRLVQREFLRVLAERMRGDALLWIATDWEDYAHWMVAILDADPAFSRVAEPQVTASSAPADAGAGADAGATHGRPRTRFEARGIRLGHSLWDLRYRRNCSSTPSR